MDAADVGNILTVLIGLAALVVGLGLAWVC